MFFKQRTIALQVALLTLALVCLTVAATECFALEVPKHSSKDSRVQSVAYHEGDVVEVNAAIGNATHILFSPDEEVLDMAVGFSDGWELVASRNNLFLKPRSIEDNGKKNELITPVAKEWNTDLHVTTNMRVYTFDLVLHHQSDKNDKIAYLVKFTYPKEEATKAREAALKRATEKRLAQPSTARNWKYSMRVAKNSEGIAPMMAWDDGRFTYLKFPGNREFPAVFMVAADQTESLVNSHIDPKNPDVLVIQHLAPEFALRLGSQAVGVFNDHYDAFGAPPKDGTTVDGVQRTLRQE